MTKMFLLITWFGVGQTQVFDTQKFDTRQQCESARIAVMQVYQETRVGFNWSTPIFKCVQIND